MLQSFFKSSRMSGNIFSKGENEKRRKNGFSTKNCFLRKTENPADRKKIDSRAACLKTFCVAGYSFKMGKRTRSSEHCLAQTSCGRNAGFRRRASLRQRNYFRSTKTDSAVRRKFPKIFHGTCGHSVRSASFSSIIYGFF